jgi:hypothetical protein
MVLLEPEFMYDPPNYSYVKEGYFPEINAVPVQVGPTEVYDDLHWQALYNWTTGHFRTIYLILC